jgi:hypothetical protein
MGGTVLTTRRWTYWGPEKRRIQVLRLLGVLAVVVLTTVVLLPTAGSATPSTTPPAIALAQVQSQLSAVTANADAPARAALTDAIFQLGTAIPDNTMGGASLSSLWADLNGVSLPVPPPYGDTVFTATEAATRDIVSILSDPTVPHATLIAAGGAIVDADEAIARAAEGLRPSAHTGRPFGTRSPAKISAYQSQWDSAYGKLGTKITKDVTSVPVSTISQAAEYALQSPVEGPNNLVLPALGSPLTSNGEPEVFYFGAEGCPYCAVDRWSMVLALSQFGQFSSVPLTVSSTIDNFPGTNTFSFYGAQYSSPYVTFVPVEGYTNQPASPTDTGPGGVCDGFPWSTLQDLSSAQQSLLAQENPNCEFGVPFLDVANMWDNYSSYADPEVIQGMSWQQIASSLNNPNSTVAQSIEGGAEQMVAEICEVTGEQPTSVCNSSVVQQWQASLSSMGHP